jgi:hypothetical protein
MKNYFNRFEDRYVFRVSTAFWHFLIGLLTISAVAGILFFLWSVIPPSKEKIKAMEYPVKTSYPPVAQVAVSDLLKEEPKSATFQPVVQETPPPSETAGQTETVQDPDKPSYDLLLLELKKIIPQDKWQSGVYVYPYGELAWQLHPANPNYRQWVAQEHSLADKLETVYQKMKLENYRQRKAILFSYLRVVKQVPAQDSYEVIYAFMDNANRKFSDIARIDSLSKAIASSIKNFRQSAEAAKVLVQFSLNNPNDCFDFLRLVNDYSVKFADSIRLPMTVRMIEGYYFYFNNNLEAQKEATSEFMQLVPQLKGKPLNSLLPKFYLIYAQKNQQRNNEIAQIENSYKLTIESIRQDSINRSNEAELMYQKKKESKSSWRMKAVYAIFGGFVAIALLGTILTLLSIQRILRKMEVSMAARNVVPDTPRPVGDS